MCLLVLGAGTRHHQLLGSCRSSPRPPPAPPAGRGRRAAAPARGAAGGRAVARALRAAPGARRGRRARSRRARGRPLSEQAAERAPRPLRAAAPRSAQPFPQQPGGAARGCARGRVRLRRHSSARGGGGSMSTLALRVRSRGMRWHCVLVYPRPFPFVATAQALRCPRWRCWMFRSTRWRRCRRAWARACPRCASCTRAATG